MAHLVVVTALLLLGITGALRFVVLPLLAWYVRRRAATSIHTQRIRQDIASSHTSVTVLGIFHPYCNAGGGGERVLWCSVAAIQERYPRIHCVVYTGDAETKEEILANALQRFGVKIAANKVSFIHLRRRNWVEAATFPRFTMLGQSLGSVVLGWEALTAFQPDVYYDSMGYAFTYPLFALLASCPVSCYVHYPTISTDMLSRVQERQAQVNNDASIALSPWRSQAKVLYYRAFAWLYRLVGSYASVAMVNSTWTFNHITALWRLPTRTFIVAPPCDTASLQQLPLGPRKPVVVSVAQFRPEKNHALQVRAFARFLATFPQHRGVAKLVMVGGCRNSEDEARVRALASLAEEQGLRKGTDVEIVTNAPLSQLRALLGSSLVGLHTMRDEHFGIGVVEYMAAGTIALAHDSAGPRSDIVVDADPRIGYRAATEEEYVQRLGDIFSLSQEERTGIQERARAHVADRFSEQSFARRFLQHMQPLLG